jgi:hypothetical protein
MIQWACLCYRHRIKQCAGTGKFAFIKKKGKDKLITICFQNIGFISVSRVFIEKPICEKKDKSMFI